jgi:hypothetical protein
MTDRKIRTNFARDRALSSPDELQLPLSREQVLSAERRWGGDRRALWESQWHTVETFAGDIWSTPDADVDRLQRIWITLAYAVGNFKRQGNTTIHPLPAPWRLVQLPGSGGRRSSLSIPTDGEAIELHSSGTTAHLGEVSRGLASPPTGSALLAALWPDEHAILDIRDFQVIVGLLANSAAEVVAEGERSNLLPPNWDEYRWFRALIKAETTRLKLPSLLTLERALYVAYGCRPSQEEAREMTWRQWGCALLGKWTTC